MDYHAYVKFNHSEQDQEASVSVIIPVGGGGIFESYTLDYSQF